MVIDDGNSGGDVMEDKEDKTELWPVIVLLVVVVVDD